MNPRNRCWHYTCIRRDKEADEALGNSGERKLGGGERFVRRPFRVESCRSESVEQQVHVNSRKARRASRMKRV
jgi:hypothetical protein